MGGNTMKEISECWDELIKSYLETAPSISSTEILTIGNPKIAYIIKLLKKVELIKELRATISQ